MKIKAGSTNVSVYYYIVQDASATSPGEPVTGLLFSDIETGGSASYARQGAARVDLTLITLASASAGHADGGFILVDDTNMPGLYRCDYPDAAFATGVDQIFCQIVIASAKNAIAAPILVDIDDNVDQTGDHTAAIADIPTVAEFNARTLVSAGYASPTNITAGTITTTTNLTNNNDKSGYALTTQDWNVGKTGYSISGTKTTLDALNDFNATTDAVANVTLVATTTTNTDMRGTDNALLAVSAPTNFSDLAITVTTGLITVGTNNDKTGYSLSQAFPTNFASQSISVTGDASVDINKINGGTITGDGKTTPFDIA